MKSFDMHMKAWIGNQAGLLQSHHIALSAYLQDWKDVGAGTHHRYHCSHTVHIKIAIGWFLL